MTSKNQIKCSPLELMWLYQRGGRKAVDVLIGTDGKKYVFMDTPEGRERVYVGTGRQARFDAGKRFNRFIDA